MQTFKNLIAGEWVAAANGATFENRNPAKTDEVIGAFPSATADDVNAAVAAAKAALPAWAGMPAPARGAAAGGGERHGRRPNGGRGRRILTGLRNPGRTSL